MRSTLAIGDFARATHLSIKTLRHYHSIGLLRPDAVDPATGRRRYLVEQIPTGQVIRRFRALEMPLETIRAVLAAPDIARRDQLILDHLSRLEQNLAHLQDAVSSLRSLLQVTPGAPADIEHRSVGTVSAAGIREDIDVEGALPWLQGAIGELHATLAAQGFPASGTVGAIWSNDLFSRERGQATVFLPCAGAARAMGRVIPVIVPGTELAVITHAGPHADIDRAYGLLATYVADHALAVEGPVREYYLVGSHDTSEESKWRTEVGWPIFQTGKPLQASHPSPDHHRESHQPSGRRTWP